MNSSTPALSSRPATLRVSGRLAAAAALALVLAIADPAAASYTPPPLPTGGSVVSTGGWLAPYDIRKYNEEIDTLRIETGYQIDVLLVGSLDGTSIDEVAQATAHAWKPGEMNRENGILLVVAPSGAPEERKARLVAGKNVKGLTEDKARQILQEVIAPRIKASDVRGAIAEGVAAIGLALGTRVPITDGGFTVVADAGPSAGMPATAAAPSSARPSDPPNAAEASNDVGASVLYGIGGFVVLVVAYVAFARLRGGKG
jgi:uncharacterized protein